jgi:hypothetical protein
MTPAQLAQADAGASPAAAPAITTGGTDPSPGWLVVAAWLAVGIPMAWGVSITVQKAAPLIFR